MEKKNSYYWTHRGEILVKHKNGIYRHPTKDERQKQNKIFYYKHREKLLQTKREKYAINKFSVNKNAKNKSLKKD